MKLQVLARGIRAHLTAALSVAALLLFTVTTSAAQGGAWNKLTFNVGAGVSPLTGQVSTKLDNGWNLTFGAGYRFTPHFSTGLQFAYNGLGVSSSVLREAAVPDGNAHLWSISLEPRINMLPEHELNPYLVGGVGYYRRVVNFTSPTLQPVIIYDPIFGLFPGYVGANQLLGSISRSGIGGSAGLGFDINISGLGRTKLFTEARYVYANTGALPTRVIPVTFGIRF